MGIFGTEISKDAVCIYGKAATKHDALDTIIAAIVKTGVITDATAFGRAVREREAVMSTGIGLGVAIPHVRTEAVQRPTVGIGISKDGIDFNTLDNEPVHIIVLFAMPAGSQKEYLSLLAQVMVALKTPGFRDRLIACSNPDEVLSLLNSKSDA